MSATSAAIPKFGSVHPASLRPALSTMQEPKVLLCDLDGTLIDSMPTLAELATDVMGDVYGTPRVLARELYVATCGLPFIRQLESIFPGDARNRGASDLFEGRKPDRCDQIRMAPDVERALSEIRARGIAIVVSSNNGVQNVATFARNAGFGFDLALGFGGGMAKGKPHIDRAAVEFGVERSQMLFVGDSLHDGEIAETERVPFVGVAGTFSFERFTMRFPHLPVIRRFGDLPGLIFGGWSQATASEDAPLSSRLAVGNG
ncbi:MAG: HAD family hydrolase [Deltaproteobacteria bacterium]|nr:HAD family hydrolase [Deltaproteobacteria bacterium]